MHPGGGDVGQNALSINFPMGKFPLKQLFDSGQPLSLGWTAQERFSAAYGHVLKKGEHCIARRQTMELTQDLRDYFARKIVERQARHDPIVRDIGLQVFHWHLEDAHPLGNGTPAVVVLQPIA